MSEVIELVGGPLDGLLLQATGQAPDVMCLPLYRVAIGEPGSAPEREVEFSSASYRRQEFRHLKGRWTFSYVANP